MATVRELLSAAPKPDVNQPTADGSSALHWAVYYNDAELVNQLIKAGANVNAKNLFGASPMSEAAVVGNVKVLKALLDGGRGCRVRERRRADGADDPVAHEQCGGGEAADLQARERERAREVARPDAAHVGGRGRRSPRW